MLEMLQRRYPRDPRVQNWLLREYRRGRLTVSPQWMDHTRGLVEAEQDEDEAGTQHWNSVLDDPNRPDVVLWHPNPEGGHPLPVQPGMVQGIGQMMDRGMRGRGVDIMNHTFGDFLPKYEQWNAQQRKRDPNSGQIVHSFPNGWTMRRLQNKDEAYDEGEVMQNCVPKFAPSVENGGVHIFSLRDPKNNPHVNVLMQPGSDGHWSNGYVRDIRGKQNDRPTDEYRDMVRSWFDTFDPKPPVQFDPTPAGVAQHPGYPEDYGLEDMNYRQAKEAGGWRFDSAWDGFIVESNFNKVRNMLRKNNQLTPTNDIVNEMFRKIYGHDWDPNTGEYTPHTHADPYAEWLHREYRKNRLYPGVNVGSYEGERRAIENEIRAIEENHPDQAQQIREIVDDPDRAKAFRKYDGNDYLRLRDEIDGRHIDNIAYYLNNLGAWERYKNDPVGNGVLPQVVNDNGINTHAADPASLKFFPKILQRRKDKGLEANISKIFANKYPESDQPDYDGPANIFEEAKQEAQLDRLLKHGGVVEHEFPDGWTMRRINDPEAGKLEGELMGHCMGSYGDRIANGTSLNYSLRDPRGFPHATFELKPTRPVRMDWDAAEGDPEYQKVVEGDDLGNRGHDRTYQELRYLAEREAAGHEISRYEHDPDLYAKYLAAKKVGIKNGWVSPDPRGADASQIQGKGNVAPEPKYHKYIKEWADTFPYEDRPKSSWRSYFMPRDAMYPEQLPDVLKKVDEFGFQAPNRSVDWDSIVKGLNGQSPQWDDPNSHHKQFRTPDEPEEGYNPQLGQQVYDFARQNGHLVPFYKAVNDITKTPTTRCPKCQDPDHGRPDFYDNGYTYCGGCGENRPTREWQVKTGPDNPPQTPYQGQLVSHLGSLFSQHPELQQYAAHNAPNLIKPKCPECGGQIGTCNACPGTDHGICENCGAYYQYPGQHPEGGAMPGVEAAWHFGGPDCPHLRDTRWPVAHVGANGQECHCLWHSASSGDVDPKVGKSAKVVVADKLNDFLRSPQARPDLQTPEAQEFLNHVDQFYHNDQTDALTPWLTREWKKGRITPHPAIGNWEGGLAKYLNAGLQYQHTPAIWENGEEVTPANHVSLTPGEFTHWGEWNNSNHETRRGVDPMKLQTHEFRDKVREWDEAMKKQMGDRAENMGQVVHRWPDGWTVQRLLDDKHLKEEGDAMGHCVGGYGNRVRHGDSLIYSVRDHNNEPHVTMEVEPHYDKGHYCTVDGCDEDIRRGQECPVHGKTTDVRPDHGRVIQIQGKANESPQPEYQQRVKEWMEAAYPNEEDRPEWDDQEIDTVDNWQDQNAGYTEYHRGDYGLNEPHYNFNWDILLDDAHDPNYAYGESYSAQDVVDVALDSPDPERSLRDLESEAGDWHDRARHSFADEFRSDYEHDPERYLANHGWEWDEEYPSEDEYTDEEGEFNEDEYDDAVQDWEERRQEWYDKMESQLMDEVWEDDPRNNWYYDLEYTIRNAMTNVRQREAKNLNRYHAHFSTGLPCRCRFTKHLDPGHLFASVPTCDVCGDPLEDGVFCKRCEWGGWSNPASDQNPPDPFRDLKGPFQSKTADKDAFGFGKQGEEDWDDTFNVWNMRQQTPQLPSPHNVMPSAPDAAPQFISPAQREQVIYKTLQEAWSDLRADPWDGSITTIREVLPEELIQKGVAPDIAQEVAQEWEQKAQEWFSKGQTDLTVPKEWTAHIATHYAAKPSIPRD